MSKDTAYTYLADKNPGTPSAPASIPGVPLDDLTKEQVDQLPRHVRRDIAGSSMYRASKLGQEIEAADTKTIEQEAKASEKATAEPAPADTPARDEPAPKAAKE